MSQQAPCPDDPRGDEPGEVKARERGAGVTEGEPFVPVLTVLAEYGNAPFLWLVDQPGQGGVGGNICDGSFWDDELEGPMSEGLWRKFADWAIEFDRAGFYLEGFVEDFDISDWDWMAFHARGLRLSRWLKDEVGDAYRVVYCKPWEDPNHSIEQRREILRDGSLRPLPPFPSSFPEPARMCGHIISGGQTGADRAALDFAIKHGYTHGGWAPQGREAEDGPIPLKYQLTELPDGGYRQRTRRNVKESDGTLILNLGELDGGSLTTQGIALKLGKPSRVVQLDAGATRELVGSTWAWLQAHRIHTLNVAGPRESKRPGIYRLTRAFLLKLDRAARRQAQSTTQGGQE